ncbi:MAG TPA: hypothetical protein VK192_13055, partial [Sphingomicrobium sp.]|nr:hypothetical protein [Sphingomicrobium sp.]
YGAIDSRQIDEGVRRLALSIARQLGFFCVLDLKLLSLFLVDDVIRNSLAAVPFTLFSWGLALMFVQAEVIPLPRVGAFFFDLKNPAFELKFALVMAVVYFLFWESWPAWLIFQSILIYAATIAWLRQRGKLDKLPIDVVYLFWLIVSAFLYGANEGQHAFNATDRDYELTLQAGSTMDANLLRATSDFFIVMEQPSEILVVPRSDVKLLKRKNLTPPHALISLPGVWRWLQSKMGGGTT